MSTIGWILFFTSLAYLVYCFAFPEDRPKFERGRKDEAWVRINLGIFNKLLRRSHRRRVEL